uniref:Uncharacterized protein n=1 Tax=Brassica campestris TaxID=3711 RepID=M4EQS6_BRACM
MMNPQGHPEPDSEPPPTIPSSRNWTTLKQAHLFLRQQELILQLHVSPQLHLRSFKPENQISMQPHQEMTMRSEKSSSNSPFPYFSGDISGLSEKDLSSRLIHFWEARNTAKTGSY